MKRRWWVWFGLVAGVILCLEAGMLLYEGTTGDETPLRDRLAGWWDRLLGRQFTVVGVADVDNIVLINEGAKGGADNNPAPVNDWPMFGGTPQRNMVSLTAHNIPDEWSVEKGKFQNIKWSADLGNKSYGGPVVADGKVFFGTNNAYPRDKAVKGYKAILMCFNEADGKFLWQSVHEIPADSLFNLGRGVGLCSVPTVEGRKHYYVTNACEVICAENDTGKPIWRYDMMDKLKVVPFHLANCSPLIVDDLVLVVTSNGVGEGAESRVASPKAPSFAAFHKETGKLAWQSNLPGENIIEGQWSNPTLAVVDGKKQVIFPGGDCWLYSLEPKTGELIWKMNCNPLRNDPKADDGFTPYIVATPVVHGDRCYVGLGVCPDSGVTLRYSYFLCVDITKKGDVSPKTLDAKDTANKSSALVWAVGGPINPVPKKGRRVHFGKTMSTCAVHEGLVYVAEDTGFVYCFDAKTGERYWVDDLKTGVYGSPFYADGRVFLGTQDQEIIVYQAGKKLNRLREIAMGEGIESTPCYANGVLYVSTHSKLYAIAEKK
jgi:outer membrane protein assembly factor BamB